MGEVGEPVGAIHPLAGVAALGLDRDRGAVLLEHRVQIALGGLQGRILRIGVLDAHRRVEGLLRDVLRLDVAALIIDVELAETKHVRRGGLDELLVRGTTAVAVHALFAAAAGRERNEDKRRRNDADSPQDGRIIGALARPRHHPFQGGCVPIATTRR